MVENLHYYNRENDIIPGVEIITLEVTRDGNKIPITATIPLLTAGIKSFDKEGKIAFTYAELIEILEFYKLELRKISGKEKVKTLTGWRNSGVSEFDDYVFVGDEVDEDIVDYFAGCVPPLVFKSDLMQCGEEYDTRYKDGKLGATYKTFSKENGRWVYKGHCFKDDTEDCGRYDGVALRIGYYKSEIKEGVYDDGENR